MEQKAAYKEQQVEYKKVKSMIKVIRKTKYDPKYVNAFFGVDDSRGENNLENIDDAAALNNLYEKICSQSGAPITNTTKDYCQYCGTILYKPKKWLMHININTKQKIFVSSEKWRWLRALEYWE